MSDSYQQWLCVECNINKENLGKLEERFLVYKQKLVLTDELIKKYSAKCKENESVRQQLRKCNGLVKQYREKLINALTKTSPLEKELEDVKRKNASLTERLEQDKNWYVASEKHNVQLNNLVQQLKDDIMKFEMKAEVDKEAVVNLTHSLKEARAATTVSDKRRLKILQNVVSFADFVQKEGRLAPGHKKVVKRWRAELESLIKGEGELSEDEGIFSPEVSSICSSRDTGLGSLGELLSDDEHSSVLSVGDSIGSVVKDHAVFSSDVACKPLATENTRKSHCKKRRNPSSGAVVPLDLDSYNEVVIGRNGIQTRKSPDKSLTKAKSAKTETCEDHIAFDENKLHNSVMADVAPRTQLKSVELPSLFDPDVPVTQTKVVFKSETPTKKKSASWDGGDSLSDLNNLSHGSASTEVVCLDVELEQIFEELRVPSLLSPMSLDTQSSSSQDETGEQKLVTTCDASTSMSLEMLDVAVETDKAPGHYSVASQTWTAWSSVAIQTDITLHNVASQTIATTHNTCGIQTDDLSMPAVAVTTSGSRSVVTKTRRSDRNEVGVSRKGVTVNKLKSYGDLLKGTEKTKFLSLASKRKSSASGRPEKRIRMIRHDYKKDRGLRAQLKKWESLAAWLCLNESDVEDDKDTENRAPQYYLRSRPADSLPVPQSAPASSGLFAVEDAPQPEHVTMETAGQKSQRVGDRCKWEQYVSRKSVQDNTPLYFEHNKTQPNRDHLYMPSQTKNLEESDVSPAFISNSGVCCDKDRLFAEPPLPLVHGFNHHCMNTLLFHQNMLSYQLALQCRDPCCYRNAACLAPPCARARCSANACVNSDRTKHDTDAECTSVGSTRRRWRRVLNEDSSTDSDVGRDCRRPVKKPCLKNRIYYSSDTNVGSEDDGATEKNAGKRKDAIRVRGRKCSDSEDSSGSSVVETECRTLWRRSENLCTSKREVGSIYVESDKQKTKINNEVKCNVRKTRGRKTPPSKLSLKSRVQEANDTENYCDVQVVQDDYVELTADDGAPERVTDSPLTLVKYEPEKITDNQLSLVKCDNCEKVTDNQLSCVKHDPQKVTDHQLSLVKCDNFEKVTDNQLSCVKHDPQKVTDHQLSLVKCDSFEKVTDNQLSRVKCDPQKVTDHQLSLVKCDNFEKVTDNQLSCVKRDPQKVTDHKLSHVKCDTQKVTDCQLSRVKCDSQKVTDKQLSFLKPILKNQTDDRLTFAELFGNSSDISSGDEKRAANTPKKNSRNILKRKIGAMKHERKKDVNPPDTKKIRDNVQSRFSDDSATQKLSKETSKVVNYSTKLSRSTCAVLSGGLTSELPRPLNIANTLSNEHSDSNSVVIFSASNVELVPKVIEENFCKTVHPVSKPSVHRPIVATKKLSKLQKLRRNFIRAKMPSKIVGNLPDKWPKKNKTPVSENETSSKTRKISKKDNTLSGASFESPPNITTSLPRKSELSFLHPVPTVKLEKPSSCFQTTSYSSEASILLAEHTETKSVAAPLKRESVPDISLLSTCPSDVTEPASESNCTLCIDSVASNEVSDIFEMSTSPVTLKESASSSGSKLVDLPDVILKSCEPPLSSEKNDRNHCIKVPSMYRELDLGPNSPPKDLGKDLSEENLTLVESPATEDITCLISPVKDDQEDLSELNFGTVPCLISPIKDLKDDVTEPTLEVANSPSRTPSRDVTASETPSTRTSAMQIEHQTTSNKTTGMKHTKEDKKPSAGCVLQMVLMDYQTRCKEQGKRTKTTAHQLREKEFQRAKDMKGQERQIFKKDLKSLLSRNVTSGEFQQLLHKFGQMDTDSAPHVLAKYVLRLINKDNEQNLDYSNHLCVPPMTPSQQCLVTLVLKLQLQYKAYRNLTQIILLGIEYQIFRLGHAPDVTPICSLARFYTAICRILRDKPRVQAFCYDAMYCLFYKAFPLLFTVLMTYPEVIPHANVGKDVPLLVLSMTSLLLSQTVDMTQPEYRVDALKTLLQTRYGYSRSTSSEELLSLLVDRLRKSDGSAEGLEPSLILLAKRIGWETSYRKLLCRQLIPLIDEWKKGAVGTATVKQVILAMGNIARCFPAVQAQVCVQAVLNVLGGLLLEEKNVPMEMQEAVVTSLLRLSRHNFFYVSTMLTKWRPDVMDISDTLRSELLMFFENRNPKWWRTFLNKLKVKVFQ